MLTLILGIGGLLAVTYGAAIGGSEWGWGTLKAAVARGESRSGYTLLNYAAVAVFVVIGLVISYLLGVVAAAFGAVILGAGLDGMSNRDALLRLPELFGRAGLALAMNAAFGYAVATVARSQLAGIAVGVGLYFAEGIAGIFLSDVFKWFPFSASSAVTAASGAAAGGGATDPDHARSEHGDPRGRRLARRRARGDGRVHGARGDRRLAGVSRAGRPAPASPG